VVAINFNQFRWDHAIRVRRHHVNYYYYIHAHGAQDQTHRRSDPYNVTVLYCTSVSLRPYTNVLCLYTYIYYIQWNFHVTKYHDSRVTTKKKSYYIEKSIKLNYINQVLIWSWFTKTSDLTEKMHGFHLYYIILYRCILNYNSLLYNNSVYIKNTTCAIVRRKLKVVMKCLGTYIYIYYIYYIVGRYINIYGLSFATSIAGTFCPLIFNTAWWKVADWACIKNNHNSALWFSNNSFNIFGHLSMFRK